MEIHGFQKMTLLDFPGRVACTVFTGGCNLRCPFCHNASLVTDITDAKIEEKEILAFLEKRKGLLDGVCITGGEPLLNKDADRFFGAIKEMGFAVKLDTNGTFPDRLEKLVSEGLVDHVAVDVKNRFEKYPETVGVKNFDVAPVKKTIGFLLSGKVSYEFRTTVVKEFHSVEDIAEIAREIRGAPAYYLQNFVDSGKLIGENLHSVGEDALKNMQAAAEKFVPTFIRGI